MIADLQELNLRSAAKVARRKAFEDYDPATQAFYIELANRYCAPLPRQEPFDWCVDNVVFADTEVNGPFNPIGRDYLRELVNNIDDTTSRENTDIMATGTSKTSKIMLQQIWTMVHNPRRGIMVMPATKNAGGSENFVSSRLIPALEATGATLRLMPNGQRRLFMNSKKVRINGSHIDYVGGGSAAAVASNRCSVIWLDEIDKFKDKLGNEAGTKKLVDERTEGVKDYTVFQSTTPTIETAQGWKALLRSDFRRRFLPCPHCNQTASGRTLLENNSISAANLKGWFDLAWSEQYCVVPDKFHNGVRTPRAFIKWDDEAKRKDGTWDKDRIVRSTRMECPHCKGHVRDEHKIWMDKNGVWIPLQENHGHKGYQLSALYAPPLVSHDEDPTHKSRLAGRALKFLAATEDGEGMKGFINSTLAEVDVAQENTDRSVIEITSQDLGKSTTWFYELSADRQAKYPGFWYRVRRWIKSILRAQRLAEQQSAWLNALPAAQKKLTEKITGSLVAPKEDSLYSPHAILGQMQRHDEWPTLAAWLVANNLTGKKLSEFFQTEFQTDLIRLLEFIAKQPTVNLALGKQGDSELMEFGSADSWEEIEDARARYNIANPNVIVDAAYGQNDPAEVYAECYRQCPPQGLIYYSPIITPFGPRGKFSKTPMPGYKLFAELGWTPCLGTDENRSWTGPDKIRLPYTREVHDPYIGTVNKGQHYQYVFKFAAQWALSELARIRKRYAFTISPVCQFRGETADRRPVTQAEYNLHMKGYYWDEKENAWIAPGKKGGSQSRRHPNHGYDCEKNGAAHVFWKGIFKYQRAAGLNQPEATK